MDALAPRLMAEAHGVLVEENARLVGVEDVLEDWLRWAVSLARALHREVMESASRIEEEAWFHHDTAFEERPRAHKELKTRTRQVKAAPAWEAIVTEKQPTVVARDQEGMRRASKETDRDREALRSCAIELEC